MEYCDEYAHAQWISDVVHAAREMHRAANDIKERGIYAVKEYQRIHRELLSIVEREPKLNSQNIAS